MMPVSMLRDAIEARPFQPFTVHVADQRKFLVPHPELVTIGPQNRTLVIWNEDGGASFLDMLMITEIDRQPPSSAE